MDRGAWQAKVCDVTKESTMTEQLNSNIVKIISNNEWQYCLLTVLLVNLKGDSSVFYI